MLTLFYLFGKINIQWLIELLSIDVTESNHLSDSPISVSLFNLFGKINIQCHMKCAWLLCLGQNTD